MALAFKTNVSNKITYYVEKKDFSIIVICIITLLIPLITMQLTDEVNWTVELRCRSGSLLGAGTVFTLRKVNKPVPNHCGLQLSTLSDLENLRFYFGTALGDNKQ
jgi:predicted membrane channel-forming protein YqfA (hemolysin III family)